jgi:hypothetical protein
VPWSYYQRKGLIQEGECINVGAGSAWPLFTGFPNSFTNNRLGCGHHNTKQSQKTKNEQKVTGFH